MKNFKFHRRNKRRRRRNRVNKRKKIVSKLSSQGVLDNLDIPEDLVDEILTRLPLKSLIQFKSVSKLWHATISNPNFHGRRRSATRIFTVARCDTLVSHTIDEKGSVEKFQAPDWCNICEHRDKNERTLISNSCNGMLLLCLGKRIFVLNPSTHYIDRVLTLSKEGCPDNGFHNFDDAIMGFCYDESIGDYKALIFSNYFKRVLVASLKEKKWTELRKPTGFIYIPPGPLVNDRLHAHDDIEIVCFNPTSNIFESIPCPQPESGYEGVILGLGVLEGCLCMARLFGFRRDVEVLKMKEYGDAESWTTLFVLKDLNKTWSFWRLNLLLRTDDGDILFEYKNVIWRYNLANESYREIGVLGGDFNKYSVHATYYGKKWIWDILYKGRLDDGTLVAVKRLEVEQERMCYLDYKTEVEMISMAVHRNLVRLQGFCVTPIERFLVYPYMANGNVASWLRDRPDTQSPLDWAKRKQIALGSAVGLAFLHKNCVIHGDVKPANICLDEEFEAKVGDYWFAKLMDYEDAHVSTVVVGTIGYLDPEYFSTGKASLKNDVYSYGVMLLELITGKRVIDFDRPDGVRGLAPWAYEVFKEDKVKTLDSVVDTDLIGNYIEEEVLQLIHIALLCTQFPGYKRPEMAEVVRMLEGDDLSERWEEWWKENVYRQESNNADHPNADQITFDYSFNIRPEELSGPR